MIPEFDEFRSHDEAPRRVAAPRVIDHRRTAQAMASDNADWCPPEEASDLALKLVGYGALGLIVPALIFWGIPLVAALIQFSGSALRGAW